MLPTAPELSDLYFAQCSLEFGDETLQFELRHLNCVGRTKRPSAVGLVMPSDGLGVEAVPNDIREQSHVAGPVDPDRQRRGDDAVTSHFRQQGQ